MGHRRYPPLAVARILEEHELLSGERSVDIGHLPEAPPGISKAFENRDNPGRVGRGLIGGPSKSGGPL